MDKGLMGKWGVCKDGNACPSFIHRQCGGMLIYRVCTLSYPVMGVYKLV